LTGRFIVVAEPVELWAAGSSSGFSGIFEIVAADKPGGGRVKKETHLRGDGGCRPSLALRHSCCPICPRDPYLANGAKGPENDAQPASRPADDPTAQSERVMYGVCIGPNASPQILGTAGRPGPCSKRPSELLTRPRKVGLARSLIRPDFSEQRVFADQFQRNGVLLGQRFCCSEWRHQCCQSRRSSGFTGIFEIVAAAKAGGVG
jgi:hypothetical protein